MNTKAIKITGFDDVIKKISIFERTQLPFAMSFAMNKAIYRLREAERDVMSQTFNKTAEFTLRAPRYTQSTKKDLSVSFFLLDQAGKGNSPASYLFPQVEGGEVYVTKFTQRLRRQFPEDIPGQSYVPHWLPGPGAPPRGAATSVLAGLKALEPLSYPGGGSISRVAGAIRRRAKAEGKYFFVGTRKGQGRADKARKPRPNANNGYEGPGIYTRRGQELALVFRVLKSPIQIKSPQYKWNEERLAPAYEGMFREELIKKLSEIWK